MLIPLTWLLNSSCTVVKRHPRETPFHFENSIKIDGKLTPEEKAAIRSRLFTQIEDSVQVREASKIPWPYFPFFIPVPVIDNPHPFNPSGVKNSIINMRNMMSSLGYRKNAVEADTAMLKKGNQLRVITLFKVMAGPLYKIDTVVYSFNDSLLQTIALSSQKNALMKKGTAFDYGLIDLEIDRLTELFQNSGFYKISREDIIAEADTNYTALIDASLDPFEYAAALAKVQEMEEYPEVDLSFRLRSNRDSTHFSRYRIGKFVVYPDARIEDQDSLAVEESTDGSGITIMSSQHTFDDGFIRRNVLLKPGQVFSREAYSRTLNNFNKLGAWQNINIISQTNDSARSVDYVLKLQPAKRQFFSIDLEGSSILNTAQIVQVGSGRVGLANNFTRRHRNIGKKAIQLENNLRTGIEFNNFSRLLSAEISLTNRFTLPWLALPFSPGKRTSEQQARTVASADFSYINRFRYFQLNTFNTFLGYEWKPNPSTNWQLRPINFEYTRFNPDSLFLESINDFPLLLYTYNNGLIIGSSALFNRNVTPNSSKKMTTVRVFAEESGIITGGLFAGLTAPGKALSNLYRFAKLDVEFKHNIYHKKSSLHFRFFAGGGYSLNTRSRTGEVTLPFFKSYVAGGPNSMRGWPIRKLGIGSNIFYDTVAAGRFNDKYADMQLETNLEWRFNLFQFYGFWMRGALFTDAGNIWFRNDLSGTLKNAEFSFNKLGKDIAIASGLGARVDFNYFLLRFDLGFPIKDPRYGPDNKGNTNAQRFYAPQQGGWFVDGVWNRPAFQFAIGYPF